MTVIAWDGRTLAADKQGRAGYVKTARTKIQRHAGMLIGTAGERHVADQVVFWIKEGCNPATWPKAAEEGVTDVLVVLPSGVLLLYQSGPHVTPLENSFFAIGCGAEAAMAVVALGHNAHRAVEITCQVVADCGGGIDTLELSA